MASEGSGFLPRGDGRRGQVINLAGGDGGVTAGHGGLSNRIPDGHDRDLDEGDRMQDGLGSPKRFLEEPGGRPAKKADRAAPVGDGVPVLDLGMMENLLEMHSARILKAQRDNLEGMMSLFQEKAESRFQQIESKAEGSEQRLNALEGKIDLIQGQLARAIENRGAPGGGEPDRRFTLVFGGWPRDTRRATILQQLDECLQRLHLKDRLDSPPF